MPAWVRWLLYPAFWTLLLIPLLHGPGKLSIDYFIRRHWMGK